jgi:hypothetical protein
MPPATENISTLHDSRLGFADIAPLPHFEASFWTTEIFIVLILALAVLAGLYLLRHKFKKPKPILPELSASQLAEQKIAELLNLVQTDSISLKELSVSLSEIMRVFLTTQLNFQAVGLTVREICFALEKNSAENSINSQIKDFFNLTENYIFSEPTIEQTTEIKTSLINQTKEIIQKNFQIQGFYFKRPTQ